MKAGDLIEFQEGWPEKWGVDGIAPGSRAKLQLIAKDDPANPVFIWHHPNDDYMTFTGWGTQGYTVIKNSRLFPKKPEYIPT